MSRANKRCRKHGRWFSKFCPDCDIDASDARQKKELATSKCGGCPWAKQVGGGKITCLRVTGCVKDMQNRIQRS